MIKEISPGGRLRGPRTQIRPQSTAKQPAVPRDAERQPRKIYEITGDPERRPAANQGQFKQIHCCTPRPLRNACVYVANEVDLRPAVA